MVALHLPPSWRLPEKESTPEDVFRDRRRIVRALGLGSIAALAPGPAPVFGSDGSATPPEDDPARRPAIGDRWADVFPARKDPRWTVGPGRSLTPPSVAARVNNFYEFTPAKEKVWELARDYPVVPWTVEVTGAVAKPRTFDLGEIFSFPLEERIYRLRCVERWAMQVPWTGFPLRKLLEKVEPLGKARWVRFVSPLDPDGFPGQARQTWYDWPYHESLRIDEATHELAFLVVGVYGRGLPMQHGAPLRLAVPWKYGFKSPKSIVRIEVLEERPFTFWNDLHPAEYGFFSNVDPEKPHPRWSQQWEKDIGTDETRPTTLYNGYGKHVADMYDGSEI